MAGNQREQSTISGIVTAYMALGRHLNQAEPTGHVQGPRLEANCAWLRGHDKGSFLSTWAHLEMTGRD